MKIVLDIFPAIDILGSREEKETKPMENKMKTTSLLKKLNKMGIYHDITTTNGYNYYINFYIDGNKFSAAYAADDDVIESYCRIYAWDRTEQSNLRTFYRSFAEIIKFTEFEKK